MRRQKLSLRKVTPHILRHSHVVNALMVGMSVPMIQKPGRAQRGFQRREIYVTVVLAYGEVGV
jgi:hypothetical protein